MNQLFALSLFCFSLLLFSCNDPCRNLDCGVQGVCFEGTCFCNDWYEGINCEVEVREKYYGKYIGEIFCPDGGSFIAEVEFTAGPQVNLLLFQDMIITLNKNNIGTTPNITREIDGESVTISNTFIFNSESEVQNDLRIKYNSSGISLLCTGILKK